MRADYIVIGSGLTGATIARSLVDAGRDVLVLDRRQHVGGNVHDSIHHSGVRIHTYGPHYFRTSSDEVWAWVNRFSRFTPFAAEVQALVDGQHYSWPVTRSTIHQIAGDRLPRYKAVAPVSLEEAALSMMPEPVYRLFVRDYNEKQWGAPCTSLSPSLCKRFKVAEPGETRLTPDAKYQGLPEDGYSSMMSRMLEGIPTVLGVDYLKARQHIRHDKHLVFTGPIDEFYGFSLGRLRYRGQQRRHQYLPAIESAQPVCQVNNPTHHGGPHIRSIEWRKLMPPDTCLIGTVVTTETPFTPDSADAFEYPFPSAENEALRAQYIGMARAETQTTICGRLGECRYYDMDHAISRALAISRRILSRDG
jgi:UDP-galactopyranose mutase